VKRTTKTDTTQDPLDWFEVLHAHLMREHFHRPDTQAARAVYAAVAAHGLADGPPVWPMVVAPPGSAKTTALEPLEALANVHAIDKMTVNTFLSGQIVTGRRAPSLLHRIGPDGIVTFPDFSTVLGMKPDDRASILADLRRIFDGHLRKEVGTSGEPLEWRGRITLVVATTPDIDRHYGVFQSLGERFVMIRWQRAGGDADGEQAAIAAMNQEPATLRQTLADSVEILFDMMPDEVTVPRPMQEQIAALAEFTVRARTHVARDYSRSKALLYLPEPEAPTRLGQQLRQLARGSARLSRRTVVNAKDVALVLRVGLDCIPRLRLRVLERYRSGGLLVHTKDLPRATQKYVREDLQLVGLLTLPGVDNLDYEEKAAKLSPLSVRLLSRTGIHQLTPLTGNTPRASLKNEVKGRGRRAHPVNASPLKQRYISVIDFSDEEDEENE
jgi:hypothetical protein